jgi:hypothetical protein
LIVVQFFQRMSKYLRLTHKITFGLALALGLIATQALAVTGVTLTSGNSVVTIDPYNQMGMNTWYVDGQNQLYQQWFWYRIGQSAEQSIDMIGLPVINQYSASQMSSTYTGTGFTLRIDYGLVGGAAGSGDSTVNESITINNTSGSQMSFHFFQYSDYNLGGVNADTVQLDTDFSNALVTSGGNGMGEVVVSPRPNLGEVAPYDQTLLKLNNGVANNLDGSTGPLGPGDITFAFQWDFTLAASGPESSVQISKIKSLDVVVVPEPASALLGLVGVGLIVGRRLLKK